MEKPFWFTWKAPVLAIVVSIAWLSLWPSAFALVLVFTSVMVVPVLTMKGGERWKEANMKSGSSDQTSPVTPQSENSEVPISAPLNLRKCPKCAELIQQEATFCKHCHSKVPKGNAGAAVKKPTSKATLIVAAVLLMALVGALLDHQEEQSNAGIAAATKVSASDLYADYHTNEIDADSRYKGQWLKVSGDLDGIKKGIGDDAYLKLKTANQFMPIRASLRSSEVSRASSLSPGNKVTVTCKGTGMILGSPTLTDCVLQ